MAIIYTYPVKTSLVAADKLVISDSADNNKTKTITAQEIADFVDGEVTLQEVLNTDNRANSNGSNVSTILLQNSSIATTITLNGSSGEIATTTNISADGTLGVSGLSTLASVNINGGNIDDTVIGGTTARRGTFTVMTAPTVDIDGGNIDGTIIGASTPAAGNFSTVNIDGGNIDGTIIGATTIANGSFDTMNANTVDINGGNIDGTIIGATTKAAGGFSTVTADLFKASTNTGMQYVSSELRVGDIIGNSEAVALYADGTEFLKIDDQGSFAIDGSTGTSGQYLQSNGSGSTPTWSSVNFLDPTNTTTPSIQISGANATDANSGGSSQAFSNTQGVLNLQGLDSSTSSTVMAIAGEDNVNPSVGNLVNCFMASHLGPGYTLVGRIQADRNTNTLSFNNTSDYRLKENVSSMSGSLAKVTALNPVNYNVIDVYPNPNPVIAEGFLAHELQEQIPNAVTGVKDAVNEDGSIKAQTVDLVKIIPHLVGAIKELTARVEALEA